MGPALQVIPTAELLSSAEAAVARWEAVANHPNLVRSSAALCLREHVGLVSVCAMGRP